MVRGERIFLGKLVNEINHGKQIFNYLVWHPATLRVSITFLFPFLYSSQVIWEVIPPVVYSRKIKQQNKINCFSFKVSLKTSCQILGYINKQAIHHVVRITALYKLVWFLPSDFFSFPQSGHKILALQQPRVSSKGILQKWKHCYDTPLIKGKVPLYSMVQLVFAGTKRSSFHFS